MNANLAMALLFAAMLFGLSALAWRIWKRPPPRRGLPKDLRILACVAFAFVGLLGLLSMLIAVLAR